MTHDNRIKVRADGPLLCSGDVEVYDAEGQLLKRSDDIALCRCGHSSTKPFCDGSHRAQGFKDEGIITQAHSERIEGGGPLKISVRENAMLIAQGPMLLAGADEAPPITRNKAALCRCGRSANKPFCDGSHKNGLL